jgi:hypothetical protein
VAGRFRLGAAAKIGQGVPTSQSLGHSDLGRPISRHLPRTGDGVIGCSLLPPLWTPLTSPARPPIFRNLRVADVILFVRLDPSHVD